MADSFSKKFLFPEAFDFINLNGLLVLKCQCQQHPRARAQSKRYVASLGGPLCDAYNPTLRIFSRTCLYTTSDDDQTRQKHTTQRPTKHHHHGGGATSPSGGVDLMNLRRLRGGQPCS